MLVTLSKISFSNHKIEISKKLKAYFPEFAHFFERIENRA